MNLESFKIFLLELAAASAEVINPFFFDLDLKIDFKKDQTPVTEADREAEGKLRSLIENRFPDHGIIGEEYGEKDSDAEFVWILDPIDGTISFTHGVPLFGTLVGLLFQGQPILGMINQPASGLCCIGDGKMTTLNGKPVQVRTNKSLSDATLLTTDIQHVAIHQDKAKFEALQKQTGFFRTWGDCYGYMLLACGLADIMIDPIMHSWDLIPLIPVIEGAGGVITNWQGGTALNSDSIVAASPALHGQVIQILNR